MWDVIVLIPDHRLSIQQIKTRELFLKSSRHLLVMISMLYRFHAYVFFVR